MKTLTLLRHAKSSWDEPSLADRDRPLNRRGERDAPVMGQRISAAGIRPSLIVSSPAVRAWSTAKIVAREISYPLEFLQRESDLYHAGLETILDIVARQDTGFNNVLIVGHNPGFTDFANYLVPGLTNNLPTCGVVSVTLDCDSWNISSHLPATLTFHDWPKKPQGSP